MSGPFAVATPAYAAASIPTVPCSGKAPVTLGWTGVTVEQSLALIDTHGHCNVGALGGEPSGIVFLDDDSDDPRVAQVIREVCPETPWVRVGKKGAVYGFRYNGTGSFKIFEKGSRKPIVEHISTGGQAISIPPGRAALRGWRDLGGSPLRLV